MISLRLALGLALALAGAAPSLSNAQLGGLKRKVKARVDQATGRAVDAELDKAEHAVKCLVTDAACIQRAKAAGKAVAVTDAHGTPVTSADSAAAIAAATGAPAGPTLKPGEGAWANYDFIPGDRTLFVEDFADDNVGDFPRRLELVSGNMEVVEWQGGRYLRATSGGKVRIPLPEVLPEQFTVEFDYSTGAYQNSLKFAAGSGLSYVYFEGPESVYCGKSGVGGPVEATGCAEHAAKDQLLHGRVMADGRYVKVYLNETRVANVPNANLGRSNSIELDIRSPTFLLGHITIAAGGRKLYDALAEHGRVATHGILFDFGSDQLRPESTPTLKQIGTMLTQHPELKLTIEGHTDNIGGDATNQTLSAHRAAAVKEYLVATYSIDAGRLTTKGFGASKPVSPNATAEGRQNNRRVELVKM